MAALAAKLGEWALSKLGEYVADQIKPAIKEQLGMQADDALLQQIKSELRDVKNGQIVLNQKLDTIATEMRLGFKLQQFTQAVAKIRSRMLSFEDAMVGALASQKGKKLGDDKELQSVLRAIAQENDGIRDQLHFVQDALLSRDNPQKDSLIDVVNEYFWNMYGGSHGLSADGVTYGIPSYVKDIQTYFKSIASIQLTAIYLISWAVDERVLQAETKRTIKSLEEQAIAISDFVPSPIDITDPNGKGDAFLRRVTGNDDCFMIRDASADHQLLVLRTSTGYAWNPWNFLGWAPWKGADMCPMDYRWKIEPVDDKEGYKLIGWDINSRSHNEPRTVQWEKGSTDRFAGARNRYTTRCRGVDVVFKIVVKSTKDDKYTIIRLVDHEVAHGQDGETATWFDNRAKNPLLLDIKYQDGERFNTSFSDSTSAYDY